MFLGNFGRKVGGALGIEGLEAYLFSLENVTYQGNVAREGGAVASLIAAQVIVREVTFLRNR